MKKIELSRKVLDYWGAQALTNKGYRIKVYEVYSNKVKVDITNSGRTEAKFYIKNIQDKDLGDLGFMVYYDKENITEDLEFIDTLEECIKWSNLLVYN